MRSVTLRLRLVLAVAAMLLVGLSVFGLVTYRIYADNEFHRLDTQLSQSADGTTNLLKGICGLDGNRANGGAGIGGGIPQLNRPQRGGNDPRFTTFGELLDDSGAVVGSFEVCTSRLAAAGANAGADTGANTGAVAATASTTGTSTGRAVTSTGTATTAGAATAIPVAPALPATLPASGSFLTTGSTSGSSEWRVFVVKSDEGAPYTTVVAVSTTEVQKSLDQLVLIEAISALCLLAVLAAGSWFILRRGLQPLEQMADSARSINAGDLSQRVGPADGKSEVGQLGLALNTMLDEFEVAFQEREATELKLRQFLADASHELRTPLTSIQGFAELFRMGGAHAHVDQDIIMRRIEEESARMKRLVEDLLLLARIDQTRPLSRTPVDLSVLAADACSDAAATAPDRRITLDAPEPVVVAGDRDHLRQAIANLVTNALTHTSPATPIHVSAQMRDGRATLSVRDEGAGLDEAAKQHVFDRFWQADRARVGTGAGLGLSIVEGIAHEHGGTATADNAAEGGAIFTVSLPLG